ncbi:MAG TPA: DUF3501 family protein [Polyangia bacterium]|jgi:hypothetical protein
MKKVARGDLLELGAYEEIRPHFRARVIEEKRHRRFQPSAELSVVFENTDTVLLQIQEMLRTERITGEAGIAHELETYNELIPETGELSLTMFVEIPDREIRDRRLAELVGLENAVAIECAGEIFLARSETRGVLEGATTALHYMKVPLGSAGMATLVKAAKDSTVQINFLVRHPALTVRTPLPAAVIRALAGDQPAA